MPEIYELFGFPLADRSEEAEKSRRSAMCPFMGKECDGGGNRKMTDVILSEKPDLQKYFPNLKKISAGVCSIQKDPNDRPWIVCPRRLLYLGRRGGAPTSKQPEVHELLLRHSGHPSGTRLGVWNETKIKFTDFRFDTDLPVSFDYAFDYILMPVARTSRSEIEASSKLSWRKSLELIQAAGYSIIQDQEQTFVEDFPSGTPLIVEVMTSSTSSNDKKKRTTIPQAFEDAILGKPHRAPGINYRQVWARMVSQLIVKSQVGIEWGGKTVWVLQDTLADYISSSTALDMGALAADSTSEVNVMSFSYGDAFKSSRGVIRLTKGVLHSGLMRPQGAEGHPPSFPDMLRASTLPPKSLLIQNLMTREPAFELTVP